LSAGDCVVGGRLARQPKSREEAVATAQQLESDGWNFSLGVAQVNRYNLPKYQITYEQAFDACTSLRVGSKILEDCYVRASKRTPEPQAALHAAFSCYDSGNFTRGFKPDVAGKPSYVQKVLASAGVQPQAIPVVPSIQTGSGPKPQFDKAAGAAAPAALKAHGPGCSQSSTHATGCIAFGQCAGFAASENCRQRGGEAATVGDWRSSWPARRCRQ